MAETKNLDLDFDEDIASGNTITVEKLKEKKWWIVCSYGEGDIYTNGTRSFISNGPVKDGQVIIGFIYKNN